MIIICLNIFLYLQFTLFLIEHEARDLSCVLSSLVQLMLDPFYHTTQNFQILIQKEWIALGHPFTERHRLISGIESEEVSLILNVSFSSFLIIYH